MQDREKLCTMISHNKSLFRKNRIKRFFITTLICTVIFFTLVCIGGGVQLSSGNEYYVDYDGVLKLKESSANDNFLIILRTIFYSFLLALIYVWSSMKIFTPIIKKNEKEKDYLDHLEKELYCLEKMEK